MVYIIYTLDDRLNLSTSIYSPVYQTQIQINETLCVEMSRVRFTPKLGQFSHRLNCVKNSLTGKDSNFFLQKSLQSVLLFHHLLVSETKCSLLQKETLPFFFFYIFIILFASETKVFIDIATKRGPHPPNNVILYLHIYKLFALSLTHFISKYLTIKRGKQLIRGKLTSLLLACVLFWHCVQTLILKLK